MNDTKPKIACLPNGPYYLIYGSAPETIPYLRKADGSTCSKVDAVALCRCGGSKTKPLCDGTHSTIGFSGKRLTDGSNDKRRSYAGKAITIHDNRGICAHAGYCTDHLSTVFREEGTPWIDADGADAAAIVATIEKCPSGALSYSIDGVEKRDHDAPPSITATRNGPYAVTGGIELLGVEFGDGASKEHYTLCRCGASKNKPFCDGSHWDINFTAE
jgi:CDGSH-type Zn-finger protein